MTPHAPDPDQFHLRDEAASPGALPLAPSLGISLERANMPRRANLVEPRVLLITALAIALGIGAGFIARLLVALIAVVTNAAFYGRWSTDTISPAGHHLGLWVIAVPVIGGLIVGVMARWGSRAIRGHGIPEAMEQVLLNESKIPKRITFLKPLSAAVSIGTGGPFGAEGPIIATGGAMGSLVGQLTKMNADERKILLAAGAAAGMAATFGSPVSAVLLAVELLLFEFRPRSIVPVALASAAATAIRMLYVGTEPIFAMPLLARPSGEALAAYAIIGALVGWLAVYVTRAVYWVEDLFEKLPIHWMWWPALGGLAVGLVGYFAPHTLGVGYENIEGMVAGRIAGQAVLFLCIMKFISWSIALGSGTSGGTLAPLFTIGGGAGVALGELANLQFSRFGIDPRICALVGMAAMFAGASRALLASVVFAFETTLQPMGLLPLLSGCTAGFLVSSLLMRNTIMTEKLARRGVRVPMEYAADYLDGISVSDACSHAVVTLRDDQRISEVQALVPTHQGFPAVARGGRPPGVIPRRDFTDREPFTRVGDLIRRPPAVVFSDMSLREAADHMVREEIGRLPVVERADPTRVVGILTRSDLLSAHAQRLDDARR